MKRFIHWDSRSKTSGFYQLIDDEMIGRQSLDRIRRFGTFWYHENHMLRMYLYEPKCLQDSGRSIQKLESIFKDLVETDLESKLPPYSIHHNYAEDDGTIRDQVYVWDLKQHEHIHLYDTFKCVKITKVNHLIQPIATKTAKIDYHFLVEQ